MLLEHIAEPLLSMAGEILESAVVQAAECLRPLWEHCNYQDVYCEVCRVGKVGVIDDLVGMQR